MPSFDAPPVPRRLLWRRLSVCAGEFGLQSAHAVCGDGAMSEGEVLELMTGLVDKSLVEADTTAPKARDRAERCPAAHKASVLARTARDAR